MASNGGSATRRDRKRKQSTDKQHQPTPHPRRQRELSPPPSKPLAPSNAASKKRKIDLPQPLKDIVGGVALTFGSGDTGQLGLGEDILYRKKPAVVKSDDMMEPIVQICCGGMHTIALTKGGEVFSWGCNDEGGLGRETPEDEDCFTPGKVTFPDGTGSIVALSAGDSHSAALSAEGQLFFWGGWRDNSGSMTNPVKSPIKIPTLTRIVKIASGYHHLVILTDEGNVLTMGCGENGQLGRLAERFATRAGRNWERALMRPAIVPIKMASRQAGRGTDKQNCLTSSSDLNKSQDSAGHARTATDIWAGGFASIVKLESGAVLGFGLNSSSQLGFRSTGATAEECCVFQPKFLPTLSALEPRFVSCGHHHTLVLGRDARVYACGAKEYGACGVEGEGDVVVSPIEVEALKDVEASSVAAGIYTSYVVAADGALWSWGTGTNNALGHGDEEDHLTPEKVQAKQLEKRKAVAVVAGGQHCAVLVSIEEMEE